MIEKSRLGSSCSCFWLIRIAFCDLEMEGSAQCHELPRVPMGKSGC